MQSLTFSNAVRPAARMQVDGESIAADITFEQFSAYSKKKAAGRRAGLGLPVSCRSDGLDDPSVHEPATVADANNKGAAEHTTPKDTKEEGGLPKMPDMPDMPKMPSFGFGGSDDNAIEKEIEELKAKLEAAPENEKEEIQKQLTEAEAKKDGKLGLPKMPDMPDMPKMPSFGFGGSDDDAKDKDEEGEQAKEDDSGVFGKIGGFGSGLLDKAGGLNPLADKELERLEAKLAAVSAEDKEAVQIEIDAYKKKKEEGGIW